MTRQESFNRLRRLIVLVMLGCLMFLSDFLMEFLPNIHLVGVLIVAYTRVYRGGALIAVYVYVFLNGLYGGFATWWIPYLYVWTVLWAGVMLLPRRLPRKAGNVVCTVVCALHGLAFGTIYAPAQALLFGFSPQQTLAWIAAGLPWDVIHGVGNLVLSVVLLPLVDLLQRLERKFTVLPENH